jgi:hypothetical protein
MNRREFIAKSIASGAAVSALGARQSATADMQRDIPGSNPGTKTLMSMFELKYPILQAPTGTVAGPDVTIAVSNAGCTRRNRFDLGTG